MLPKGDKFFLLCPRDDSQGALRFAPVCLSVRLSVRPFVTLCGKEFVYQLLLQFLMDLFETLHTCCGHIEDVRVGFWWR